MSSSDIPGQIVAGKVIGDLFLTVYWPVRSIRIGVTMALHTLGSALTHHLHVHCIVPGGDISLDGKR